MTIRRGHWIALVIGVASLHQAIGWLGNDWLRLVATDLGVMITSAAAAINCAITARNATTRQHRIAWYSLAAGLAAWWLASAIWTTRELLLGHVAPAPSWLDVPFFLLAPTFAIALLFYRAGQPSRTLQLRQLADLGILTATITIVGTLVLAEPLRTSSSAYAFVAIGYPGFYLAVVLIALRSLAGDSWGRRRLVLGILIWAQVAFATVDLLYGAKVLSAVYQAGIEDTLWLIGMVTMSWAATEERALASTDEEVDTVDETSWSAIVGAIILIILVALAVDAIERLGGTEWTIIAIASLFAAGFVGLRMWIGDRTESAYLDAVASSEDVQRILDEERIKLNRLRAVGTIAGGTAHDLNNLLQAIVCNLALLRRRAKRGEDIQVYLSSIERTLVALAAQVGELRKLAPTDTARGMVFILPGGDRDGSLGVVLAEAGFAPAALPDVDTALRAAKHEVYAIVASPEEADELERRGNELPVIRRDGSDIVEMVTRIVELVAQVGDRTTGGAARS